MFTYFYNQFRLVNPRHYIKCGVNSSLLTLFWLLQKVCDTLDHCFIMTHSIHTGGDILQIYFCVIFLETRHHAQAHITSEALIHCALSLATRRTQTAVQLGRRFRWPVFVMATLESQNIFLRLHLIFQPIWGCGDFGSFQLPHLKKPEISVGIFSPT